MESARSSDPKGEDWTSSGRSRLYIIGRKDLVPGLRAAQLSHATISFAMTHPKAMEEWHLGNNNLILLEVANEADLRKLAQKAKVTKLPIARFFEPDLGGQLTAIAICGEAKKLLQELPLAFSS